MPLNRATRRKLAHNGQLEKYMNDVYEREHEKTRDHAYRHAWICMFIALVERFPELMTREMLHSIAVDTIEIANGIETPSELAAALKAETGFDVYLPPSEDEKLRYIEKGAKTDG